jgi:hypothetical protein
MNKLREIFDRYGCDKGYRHGYERLYEPIFEPVRDGGIRILEVGVGKGASIMAWLDYFAHPGIVAIDTFERVDIEEVWAKTGGMASLIKADSTDRLQVGDFHDGGIHEPFSFIVDDGNHTPLAQLATLENLFPTLAPGGRYFIEDVWPLDRMTEEGLQHPWIIEHAEDFTIDNYSQLTSKLRELQGLGHIVTIHDFRATNYHDSFVFEVQKA